MSILVLFSIIVLQVANLVSSFGLVAFGWIKMYEVDFSLQD